MRLPLSMKQKNNHLSQAALHKKSDSVFAAALCVEMTVKRRESSVTQRTAEETKPHFSCKSLSGIELQPRCRPLEIHERRRRVVPLDGSVPLIHQSYEQL